MLGLKSVQRMPNNKILLNENILVYDIDIEDDGIVYSVDYDDKLQTIEDVTTIVEKFFNVTIKGILESDNQR